MGLVSRHVVGPYEHLHGTGLAPLSREMQAELTPPEDISELIGNLTAVSLSEEPASNTMDNQENIAADGKDMDDMNLFAVSPFDWCPHLKDVCAIPANGLDVNAPCMECGNVGENWVCLICYEVCSANSVTSLQGSI